MGEEEISGTEENDPNILLFNKISDTEAGYAYSDLGLYLSEEVYSPAIIRGQSSNYWNTVYQNSPTFIAQANTAASTAPVIQGAGGSPIYTPPASSVAPPITTSTGTTGSIAMNPTTTGNTCPTGYTEPVNKFVRFCSKISAEYTFIPKGSKDSGLGLHEFDLYSRFMIPCSLLPPSTEGGTGGSFFIAPNFSLELWNDPAQGLPGAIAMPKQTFDAGVDFGIDSQFTRDFGVEAWIRLGLASSFKKVASKSFYLRGRAMGTLGITGDGRFAATLGAIYYNRNHYKLLPSGGVIWKPNDTNVWRLVFPDPRLSRHLGKVNETDWWGHIQGNIGGGRWYVEQPRESFNIDYNDYRVGVGASFQTRTGFTGNFEVGGAFGRELYAYGTTLYKPKTSVYLKVGLNY
ncbi:MAG: hypothetical protein Q4G69_03350 [Planctomycetia bacterium]|nr:hypothetical protein [Planctomycetia bacterium]